MADTELQQLIIYVGTEQQIQLAMDAGVITENDLSIATDTPEYQTLLTAANAGTGIAITNENGVVKISNTQTSAEWGNITGNIESQTDLQLALEGKQNVIVDLDTIRSGAALGATSLQPSDVVNNTTSTATDKPLSANMGKEMQDEIDNLKARGRFLSLWDCATGLPETNPPESPYTYASGDYYVICNIAGSGGTNYKPSGSSFTIGVASTTVETNEVAIDDCYFYDGTNWHLQSNAQKTLSFANIAGDPYDNSNLASALNSKVSDVQVNGTSVTTSGVANVPVATNQVFGVVKQGNGNETGITLPNGIPTVYPASTTRIDSKTGSAPIVPTNMDYALKVSMTTNTQTLTDTEKGNACDWIGAVKDVQVNGTSVTTSGVANIPKAASNTLGTIMIGSGLAIQNSGSVYVVAATESNLVNKLNSSNPVVSTNLNIAVREGLGNNNLTWSDAYKLSACKTIGTISGIQINSTDLTPDATTNKVNIAKASNDGTVVGVVQLSNTYGSQTVNGYLAAVDRSYAGFVGAQSTSIASVGGVKTYVGGMSVAYNASQSLTDAQKTQARTNIGAGTADVEFVDWE